MRNTTCRRHSLVSLTITSTLVASQTATLDATQVSTLAASQTSTLASTQAATLAATALRGSPQEQAAASIPPVIRQMIEHAQYELAHGNAAAAADLFEQAAEHGEYAEAEVGEVRARLWAGQFRHAVAISSVVAGEHPESAEAQALLGYIEDRNGYTAQALQRLRTEQLSRPQEAAPLAAEAEVLVDRHSPRDAIQRIDRWTAEHGSHPDLCRLRARAVLVQTFEARIPPEAGAAAEVGAAAEAGVPPRPETPRKRAGMRRESSPIPCELHVTRPPATAGASRWSEGTASKFPAMLGSPVTAGNGLIVDEGRRVITIRRLIDSQSASIWVRNARGELRRARLEPQQDERVSQQIATLTLSAPFALDQSFTRDASAPPNARGLCFALGFPAALSTDAMLPAVTPCFAFDPHAADGVFSINIPLSAGERGSPVFDVQGRLMGLADPVAAAGVAPAVAGAAVIRTNSALTHSPQANSPAASESQATIAMPELYERLAPAIVQIVIFPPAAGAARSRE